MDSETILATGLTDIVKSSFSAVFKSASITTETWFQKVRIRSISRERYAQFVVSTVGTFPLFGTAKHAEVESCYVRVQVADELEKERYRSVEKIEAGLRRQRKGKAINRHRQESGKTIAEVFELTDSGIAILGSAGSGKTTLLRHLVVQIARGSAIRGRKRLPIFLAVRDLAVDNLGIEEGAICFMEWLKLDYPDRVFKSLLEGGDLAIILDGLDEADKDYQRRLLNEFVSLHQHNKNSVFCVSARPYTLSIGLEGFEKWETLPLELENRFEFVKKWFGPVDPQKGEQLLNECRGNPSLLELGSNPLLLSTVCALYYNDLRVPQEPDELYARMIEGLLGAWDAFRNIARDTPLSALNVRRRRILVSWIAAEMHSQGRIVFSSRELHEQRVFESFAQATRSEPLSAEEVLTSLYSDFGILAERSPNLYSFSHLTIQEYLTARYIIDQRQELNLLSNHLADQSWFEVIRLVARMLPQADIFLTELNSLVDLRDPYSAGLIAACWEAEPICRPEAALRLMDSLVSRVANATKHVPASYSISEGILTILVEGFDSEAANLSRTSPKKRARRQRSLEKRRRRVSRRVNILRNIPAIHRALLAAGITYADLGYMNLEPFRTIMWDSDFQQVLVEGI